MAKLARHSDTRKLNRHSVFFDGTLVFGQTTKACKVLNISSGGAQIRVEAPLDVDGPVALRVRDCGEVPCEIMWQEDKTMGVLFFTGEPLKNMRMAKKIRDRFEKAPEQRRRHPRRSVILAGSVYSGGLVLDARLKDISAAGAQLVFAEDQQLPGSFLLRTERFGDFSCDVAWQTERKMGVHFTKTPKEFAEFVEHELPSED
jgi:hypothetical protein